MIASRYTYARVQVLLPWDDSDPFNAYYAKHGFKKSMLIARLVRDYLSRNSPKKPRGPYKPRKPRATAPEAAEA